MDTIITTCVLTLALDDVSQKRFDQLRQQWFPRERNFVPAHLTLFHVLPESDETIQELLTASAMRMSFSIEVINVRLLGSGVAYSVESRELLALHKFLSERFQNCLTAQDKQKFFPHIVVQNKVTPDVARATLCTLQAEFSTWACSAAGLDLWRYADKRWIFLRRFPFA